MDKSSIPGRLLKPQGRELEGSRAWPGAVSMHRGKNSSGAGPAVLAEEVNTGPAPAQTIWCKNAAPDLKESLVLFFLSQSGGHK